MPTNRLLWLFILVLGFLLVVFALSLAIALSLQGQLTQNIGSVAALAIVGLFLMAIGWKK